MDATTVTIKLLDGTEHRFETRTYMCTSDRIAFERHFKVSTGALKATSLEGIHEEWIAFFAWRAARRSLGDTVPADFVAFADALEETDLEDVSEPEAAPDPTPIPPAPTG